MNQAKHFENAISEKIDAPNYFVQQFYLNCLADFSYYVESNGEAAVIDPLRDIDQYLDFAKERKTKIKYVFETHLHADFVSGHLDIAKATGAIIVYGPTAQPNFPIKQAKDGELLPLGNIHLRVDHTPGHTMESSCFVVVANGKDVCAFTGDTLFLNEVGRPDLAVKSGEVTVEMLAGLLYDSLRNKVMKYSDDVIVYPGHGAGSSCGKSIGAGKSCSIGKQKHNNYALQQMTKEEFTAKIMDNMPAPPQYFFHDAKMNKQGPPDVTALLAQVQKPLTFEQFSAQVKSGAIIIDSRPSVAEGVIDGAVNVTFASGFVNYVGSIIKADTKIVVIAEPGQAQDTVLRLLRIGYDNVQGYLQGGFEVWKKNGGAISTTVKRVGLAEFFETPGKKEDHIFLDVRAPSEWKEAYVEGATKIALPTLEANLAKLPKNKTIHIYCKTGGRAKMGMGLLLKNGYKDIVFTEEGGITAFQESNLCNFSQDD